MPFALERLSRLMAREVYDMSRNSRLLFRGSSAELVVCGLGRRKETWADFESGLSSIICSGSEGSVLSALAFAAASNVGIMHQSSPKPRRLLSSSSNVVAVLLSSSSVAVIAVCAVSDVGAVASVPPDTAAPVVLFHAVAVVLLLC